MSYVIQDTTEQVVIQSVTEQNVVVSDGGATTIVEPSVTPAVVISGEPQQVTLSTTAAASEVGPPGPPGPSGQPRWSGDGPPGTIIGAQPGDIYLDDLSGTFYELT